MQARFSSESEGERFDKKWTKLDLLSMAKARDHMTMDLDEVLSYRLEIDYKSLYKEASSLIHFDGNSILTYTNYYVSRNEEHLIIGSKSTWAPMAAAFNVHYDIINISETAKILDININEELHEVYNKYKLQIEKIYLGESEKADDVT
ncbi:hypothetical protein BS614_11695 [Paenibacillus xylanexedens]|uniref:hypothetical protein n=1 Tax=Paenibacillus xylanexedens TaxID=528191 RepID=UPI0009385865|nr:hypothetical protein [Paenibacillus xylanexedens]APO44594.1 hypothetical protein BS614_11695 [Paenibacillus xylanexedens]